MDDEMFRAILSKLNELGIHIIGGQIGGGDGDVQSQDPADYPRSCEITDEECQMQLMEGTHKMQRIRRISAELKIAQAEFEAARQKLWLKLQDRYPDIVHPMDESGGGEGWRKWQGKYYYVGWDHDQEEKGKK